MSHGVAADSFAALRLIRSAHSDHGLQSWLYSNAATRLNRVHSEFLEFGSSEISEPFQKFQIRLLWVAFISGSVRLAWRMSWDCWSFLSKLRSRLSFVS